MEKISRTNIWLVLLWLVISLIALFNHELWRDETQVWCVVRDLGLFDIFKMSRVEGHPILWYLLVMPFAKLGLPVETMQFLSFSLVGTAVVFMLFKSSFSKFEKAIITLSAGMLYFLPTVARNYSLIPLFIFLLAYLYPQRMEKPYKYAFALICLSQTHSLMFVFAGLLFVFFAIEKFKEKKHFLPLILLFANFLGLFFVFSFSSLENNAVRFYNQTAPSLISFLKTFSDMFFYSLFEEFDILKMVILYGSIIAFSIGLFKQDKKIFSLFLLSLLYILFVFTKVWFGGIVYQKIFICLLIMIFCYWVSNKDFKTLKISFAILFLISSLLSFPAIVNEVKYQFSGSKQLATYIKENIPDKNFQFIGYLFTISPISAYLPDRNFYSARLGQAVTFMDFGVKNNNKNLLPSGIKYLVVQYDAFSFDATGYKEIFVTDNNIVGSQKEAEVYKIYEKI